MTNTATTKTLALEIGGPRGYARWVREYNGPTLRQAHTMATQRTEKLAAAQAALAAGDDDRAFNLDCSAMDLEADLHRYGFNTETGRPAAARRSTR